MPSQILSSYPKQAVSMLKSEAIIAVLSASIISPFFIPRINHLMDSVPVLKDHKSLASFVAGFVIFSISPMFKSTMLRAVVIGIAGAAVLNALLPLYNNLTVRNTGA